MMRRVAVATAIGLLLGGQAMAAEARLGAVSGSVMVSQNGRFMAATRGAVLQTGDRVMATNGSASLTYSDGCNVAVATRSMATVAAVSPCAGGSSGVVKVRQGGGQPGYSEGSIRGSIGGAEASEEDQDAYEGSMCGSVGLACGEPALMWISAGIVTVAIVGKELNNDKKPNSP